MSSEKIAEIVFSSYGEGPQSSAVFSVCVMANVVLTEVAILACARWNFFPCRLQGLPVAHAFLFFVCLLLPLRRVDINTAVPRKKL